MAAQPEKKAAVVPEKQYFQTYYVEHRDQISQKRRQRYQTDPAYREEVKRRAMARYEELRQKKLKEQSKNPREPEVRGFNRPRVMQVAGQDVLVHCVSAFAERVGRDVQTITAWEQNGIIPKPTVVDEMGRRWYSEDHMDFIAALAHEYRSGGGRDLSDFKDMVDKEWKRHKGEDKNRG